MLLRLRHHGPSALTTHHSISSEQPTLRNRGQIYAPPPRTAVSHSDPACAEAAAFLIVTSGSSDVFLQSSLAKVWAFGKESSL